MDETGTPQSSNRMLPIIVGVVLLLLVGGAVAYFAMQRNVPATETPVPTTAQEMTTQETPAAESTSPTGAQEATGEVKSFTVSGKSFSFAPATIRVNEGDTVRITFTNTGGTHNLVIDEFDVATKTLQTGQSETVEFIADKAGTYEYYCSIGNHRQMGMKGSLIVQ